MQQIETTKNYRHDGSPEADLFFRHQKGEMSFDEYLKANAVLSASHCDHARNQPRAYIPMLPILRDYCEDRILDRTEYDRHKAKKLGVWFHGIRQALEFNQERLEFYAWAVEKTTGIGAGAVNEKLSNALNRFKFCRIPAEEIRLCMQTKKLDSYAADKQ